MEHFVPNIKDELQNIVSYRNYLTHYDKNILNGKCIDVDKTIQYIEILKLLLNICFLKEFGFEIDKIDMFLKQNRDYLRIFNRFD